MIIRRIKNYHQENKILESLQEVNQDIDSSEHQESAKRTLNPEMPQSETLYQQSDQFICEPSEPMFDEHNNKTPSHCLTIERPLHYEPKKFESEIEQNSRQSLQPIQKVLKKVTKERIEKELKYSFNPTWKLTIGQSQVKVGSSKEDDGSLRPVEKKFRKKVQALTQGKVFQELHDTLNQRRRDDEQENETIKSKFNTSLMRSRLAATLSKFRSIRGKEEEEVIRQPRYSFEKSVCRAENETTRSFLTEKGSTGAILDHLKGKTSSFHSEKVKKRPVPQDVDSVDEQFSTIFGNLDAPKVHDEQEQIIPISYFQPKVKSRACITISYKTTLLELKEFCLQENIEEQEISIMIPEPLSVHRFEEGQKEEEIFRDAKLLLKQLSINASSLKIKRYTNCVIIVSGNIAIVSHFSGQVYIGGWSSGQKTGLGLQWCPGRFIYYGEYRNNKRNGVGFYKTGDGVILAGLWKNSNFEGHLLDISSVRKI